MTQRPTLPWLAPHQAFPPTHMAWPSGSDAPGLLAAGGCLDVATLRTAYAQGVFPWFSEDQPLLWWSPDPRMVLSVADFRLHRSLRKTIRRFMADAHCEIRIDTDFETVIRACARAPRTGQTGTWIVDEMVQAYLDLHRAGLAHSVETWRRGRLVGGLYCVALGQAVFGESMFAHESDSSKIALAALVAFCRAHGIAQIDCQQNTRHIASLGAAEIAREVFLERVAQACGRLAPVWQFTPLYWSLLIPSDRSPAT